MEKKSKFGWLWHNQLFRTTPLVGYGFIELAQSKVEVIFWYLTIIGFTIAAAVNMHFAYVEYSSKPTHTLVYPTARSDNLFVPNFTIKFELPTFELYNDNPTKAYRKYDSFAMPAEETGLSRYLICHILQGISQDDPVSVYANIYSVFAKLTETVDIADVEERRAAPSELSFKGNLQRWKIIQDPLYEDIVEYLDNNIDSPRERFVYDSEREKIEGLLGGALRARPHDVYGQLEILRRVTEDTNETFRSSVKRTAAQIHSSAIDALNHLFHIEVKHPKSRVSLSDWTYSTNGDEWVVLGFTADVELPQGEIELEIQLYSYFYRWLQQIHRAIDTFAQMYPLQKKDEPRKLCYAGDSSYSSLIAMTDNELLNFGYIATKSDFHLTMNNVNGEYDRAVMQQNYGVIELNPKATFTSKINNCYKSSYEECITDCMVKLSLESCVCLPWHLYRRRLHSHLSICSKPCIVKETKTEICTNDCATNSRHPCLLNQYGIDSYSHSRLLEKSKQFEAFDLPLHAMKIKLAQGIIHPSIFEEYQFTWGKYIANLGQILEFWIGLSILALIHLFVYTIKQIRKIQFKKESVTDDNKPTQLSDEINIETAKKLYEKEVKDIRNMIEPQSDGFLQQTILTGFNLIGAADTKLEKGFWWVIVAVFFAITAISIERSIYSYNVAATHTMVLPSRSSAEITISNMTLHLGLPLHDFINHNLLELGNLMKLKTNRNSVSNSLVCASIAYGASHPKTMMEVADQTLSDEITTKWTKGIFEEWHDLIEISHQTSTTIDFADSQSREFDRWRNDMNKAKQALLSFLKTKKDTKMPNTNADTKKLNAEVENLLNSVFKQRKNDTHFKLMFLESLKTNQDPRIKLWSLLNELKMTETLPAKSSFNNTPNSMLLTEPRTLLLDALADLKKFVNIKIHGASNTRIFLTDWAYFMKSNRHNKAIGAGLALISNPSMMDNMHEFTFDLLVPDDVHQMKVEIRTFTNQWHTYIEETFNEYLAWLQLNHAASYLDWTQDCEFKNILTDDLFKYSKIYREMIRTSAFVRIKMHNGYNSQVWLNPMFNAKYDAQVHNTFNAIKIQRY